MQDSVVQLNSENDELKKSIENVTYEIHRAKRERAEFEHKATRANLEKQKVRDSLALERLVY